MSLHDAVVSRARRKPRAFDEIDQFVFARRLRSRTGGQSVGARRRAGLGNVRSILGRSLEKPRSVDLGEGVRGHTAVGQGVANAAAECVHRPDPPVAYGRPLAGPAPGMHAAPAGRLAARAGFGIPVPGRAVGDLDRSRAMAGPKERASINFPISTWRRFGAGLQTPPCAGPQVSRRGFGPETYGQASGKVGRPCHNLVLSCEDSGKLFLARS